MNFRPPESSTPNVEAPFYPEPGISPVPNGIFWNPSMMCGHSGYQGGACCSENQMHNHNSSPQNWSIPPGFGMIPQSMPTCPGDGFNLASQNAPAPPHSFRTGCGRMIPPPGHPMNFGCHYVPSCCCGPKMGFMNTGQYPIHPSRGMNASTPGNTSTSIESGASSTTQMSAAQIGPTEEADTDDVIFLEEELNYDQKKSDGGLDTEYCALCFNLIGSWSACPKYSGYTEKKKHSQKHAENKDSLDWKKEFDRCFPTSFKKEFKEKKTGSKENVTCSKRKREGSEADNPNLDQKSSGPDCDSSLERQPFAESAASPILQDSTEDFSLTTASADGRDLFNSDGQLPLFLGIPKLVKSNKMSGNHTLSCGLCQKKYGNDKSTLMAHIVSHVDDPNMFHCGICRFKGKDIRNHLRIRHKGFTREIAYSCHQTTTNKLRKILGKCFGQNDKNASSAKVVKSSQNPSNTSEKGTPPAILDGTSGDPADLSERILPYQAVMKKILINKDSKTPLSCNLCGLKLHNNKIGCMDSHVLSHCKEILFQCNLCFLAFRHISPHISNCHKNSSKSERKSCFTDRRGQYNNTLVATVEKCFGKNNASDVKNSDKTSPSSSSEPLIRVKVASNVPASNSKKPAKLRSNVLQFTRLMKQKKIEETSCVKCEKQLNAQSDRSLEQHTCVHSGLNLRTCKLCGFSHPTLGSHFSKRHAGVSAIGNVVDDRYKFDGELAQLFDECFDAEITERSWNQRGKDLSEDATSALLIEKSPHSAAQEFDERRVKEEEMTSEDIVVFEPTSAPNSENNNASKIRLDRGLSPYSF